MSEKTDEPNPDASESAEPEAETYHSRIMIKPDGEVVIENLSMDLMELALMLDPDSGVACDIPGLPPLPSKPSDDGNN